MAHRFITGWVPAPGTSVDLAIAGNMHGVELLGNTRSLEAEGRASRCLWDQKECLVWDWNLLGSQVFALLDREWIAEREA